MAYCQLAAEGTVKSGAYVANGSTLSLYESAVRGGKQEFSGIVCLDSSLCARSTEVCICD